MAAYHMISQRRKLIQNDTVCCIFRPFVLSNQTDITRCWVTLFACVKVFTVFIHQQVRLLLTVSQDATSRDLARISRVTVTDSSPSSHLSHLRSDITKNPLPAYRIGFLQRPRAITCTTITIDFARRVIAQQKQRNLCSVLYALGVNITANSLEQRVVIDIECGGGLAVYNCPLALQAACNDNMISCNHNLIVFGTARKDIQNCIV